MTGRSNHYFTPGQGPDTGRPGKLLQVELRGRTLRLETAPGVFSKTALDRGTRLLVDTASWEAGAAVCDLGCGWGAVGCHAAAPGQCRVWMCDINFAATVAAAGNIRRNGLADAAVWCGDGLAAAPGGFFDVILFNPPVRAGNQALARLFDDCLRCLVQHGLLWLVLRTAQGAKSWQKRLERLFGNCETAAVDGGYRVLTCRKQ